MSVRITRAFAAIAAGALLHACGGDDGATPVQPPVAEKQPSDPESTRSKSDGIGQVTEKMSSDRRGIHLLGTDADGVAFEVSIGENAAVPKNFPADIPIPPGSEPMAALSSGAGGGILTLKSSEEQSKIREYFLSELPKNGWTIQSERTFGGQIMIDATQGSRKATVTIAGTSGDSRLSIILSSER